MTTSRKVQIIIFGLLLIFYLGVAITANAYLWFAAILLSIIGLFFLQDFIGIRSKSVLLIKIFPILFIALFIYANEASRTLIIHNPQSISVYYDEDFDQERVVIQYGIYNSMTMTEKNIARNHVELRQASSGYELIEAPRPGLEIFTWIYIFIGLPIYLIAVISILNETRTNPNARKHGGRESILKVLWSAGQGINSRSSKSSHLSREENFIGEKAKSDILKDKDNK